uniref:Uncharacterized protein n=1 Tax=Fagus sylvatica TaxID=28930 RepID=A0A2N9F823_FAGSY
MAWMIQVQHQILSRRVPHSTTDHSYNGALPHSTTDQQMFEQYSNINGLLAPHSTKDAEDDYYLTEEELEELMSSPDLDTSGHDAFTSLTQLLVSCITVLNLSSNVRLAGNMHMELDWFKACLSIKSMRQPSGMMWTGDE